MQEVKGVMRFVKLSQIMILRSRLRFGQISDGVEDHFLQIYVDVFCLNIWQGAC